MSNRAAAPTCNKSYLLGLFFIICVVIIWSLASILVQHIIYRDLHFNSPFLLTYFCTSMFTVLLPSRFLWDALQKRLYSKTDESNFNDKVIIVPFKSGPPPLDDDTYAPLEESMMITRTREEGDGMANSISAALPLNVEPKACSQQKQDDSPSIEIAATRAYQSTSPTEITIEVRESEEITTTLPTTNFILGHYETFLISARIAPLWFISNYTYNLSLDYTSITSSTVLASLGSLFTFMFALCCRDETFRWVTLVGVILCVLGSVLTCLGDDNGGADGDDDAKNRSVWGDFAGLIAAVGYGGYTVLIRKLCPKDERHISMQLMFGYIGLLNGVILSPVAIIYLIRTDGGGLSWVVIECLVIKGLFDNVLSDYLWARAVVLTSATVATVGLALTIPFAFLTDFVIGQTVPGWETVLGAFAVLVGFILVNVGQVEGTVCGRRDNS